MAKKFLYLISLYFAFESQAAFTAESRQYEPHIKRPMNCFMLFRQERYPQIKEEGLYKQQDISKIIGIEWKQLPEKEKSLWKKKAEILAKKHKIKYPSYKYQPKQKKGKQAHRKRKRSESSHLASCNKKKSKAAPSSPHHMEISAIPHVKQFTVRAEAAEEAALEEDENLRVSEWLEVILNDLSPTNELA